MKIVLASNNQGKLAELGAMLAPLGVELVRQVRFREPKLYMDKALEGRAVTQETEVSRAELPFEFMLNALRLKEGFKLQDFVEKTGLPFTAIAQGLEEAERKGLIERDFVRVKPTERGFDFLNDLQSLFL